MKCFYGVIFKRLIQKIIVDIFLLFENYKQNTAFISPITHLDLQTLKNAETSDFILKLCVLQKVYEN